jgi:hypothetical protein
VLSLRAFPAGSRREGGYPQAVTGKGAASSSGGPVSVEALPYESSKAWTWRDVKKYLAELFPRAQASGLFNLAIAFNQAITGNQIVTGTSMEGQPMLKPRWSLAGPDLIAASATQGQEMVKVFHGCYPSQVYGILDKDWGGSLTDEDYFRQREQHPGLNPVVVGYVTLDKETAAGYPLVGWTTERTKLGEKFTTDDTPPYTCVLEGTMTKWNTDDWISNVRWNDPGEEMKDGSGDAYRANQQWAVVPESVTWEVIHYYPTDESLKDMPLGWSLKEDLGREADTKKAEREWNRRCRLAKDHVRESDLKRLQRPVAPVEFGQPRKIPDDPKWIPGGERKRNPPGTRAKRIREAQVKKEAAKRKKGEASDSGDQEAELGELEVDSDESEIIVKNTFIDTKKVTRSGRKVKSEPAQRRIDGEGDDLTVASIDDEPLGESNVMSETHISRSGILDAYKEYQEHLR